MSDTADGPRPKQDDVSPTQGLSDNIDWSQLYDMFMKIEQRLPNFDHMMMAMNNYAFQRTSRQGPTNNLIEFCGVLKKGLFDWYTSSFNNEMKLPNFIDLTNQVFDDELLKKVDKKLDSSKSFNTDTSTITDTSVNTDACQSTHTNANTDAGECVNTIANTDAGESTTSSFNTDACQSTHTNANMDAGECANTIANTDAGESTNSSVNTDACQSTHTNANTDAGECANTIANTDAGESTNSSVNTDACQSTHTNANTDAGECANTIANTDTGESTNSSVNTDACQSTHTNANTDAGECVNTIANTDTGESTNSSVNTDACQSTHTNANTDAGECVNTIANTDAGESTNSSVNTDACQSIHTNANTDAGECANTIANTDAGESTNSSVNTDACQSTNTSESTVTSPNTGACKSTDTGANTGACKSTDTSANANANGSTNTNTNSNARKSRRKSSNTCSRTSTCTNKRAKKSLNTYSEMAKNSENLYRHIESRSNSLENVPQSTETNVETDKSFKIIMPNMPEYYTFLRKRLNIDCNIHLGNDYERHWWRQTNDKIILYVDVSDLIVEEVPNFKVVVTIVGFKVKVRRNNKWVIILSNKFKNSIRKSKWVVNKYKHVKLTIDKREKEFWSKCLVTETRELDTSSFKNHSCSNECSTPLLHGLEFSATKIESAASLTAYLKNQYNLDGSNQKLMDGTDSMVPSTTEENPQDSTITLKCSVNPSTEKSLNSDSECSLSTVQFSMDSDVEPKLTE